MSRQLLSMPLSLSLPLSLSPSIAVFDEAVGQFVGHVNIQQLNVKGM